MRKTGAADLLISGDSSGGQYPAQPDVLIHDFSYGALDRIRLGKPFWGQGIMPEAVKEMLRHAFEDIGMTRVWVGYYEGNTKSKRVQEKCRFRYQWKSEDVDVRLMHEKRTGHVSLMTKEDWMAELQLFEL